MSDIVGDYSMRFKAQHALDTSFSEIGSKAGTGSSAEHLRLNELSDSHMRILCSLFLFQELVDRLTVQHG